jgi:hypothetical protein
VLDKYPIVLRRSAAVLAVVAILVTGCGSSDSDSGAESGSAEQSRATTKVDHTFQATEDGFVADFGGEPSHEVRQIAQDGFEGEVSVYKLMTEKEEVALSIFPAVGIVDLSSEARNKAEQIAAGFGGSVKRFTDTKVLGRPAADFEIDGGDAYARGRLLLLDERLWTFVGVTDAESIPATHYRRLLETFKLTASKS